MPGCNCAENMASMSLGTYIEVKSLVTQQWINICGLNNIGGPSSSASEVDVTTLCSTMREFLRDLPDPGQVELSGNALFGDAGQIELETLFRSGEITDFRIILTDKAYADPVYINFKAFVMTMPYTFATGAVKSVSFTLRLSGDVAIVRPDSGGAYLSYTPTVLSESAANDGSVSGVVSIVLTGDAFTGTAGSAMAGVTFTGVPAGLTANAQKISDTTVIVNFSGNAISHDVGTSAAISVTFADAAFTTGPASSVTGSVNRQITINFV